MHEQITTWWSLKELQFYCHTGKCHKSISVLRVSEYVPHTRRKSTVLFPLLCSEWASGICSLCCKGFRENHTAHQIRGKTLFVWWVLLLQFICLHVWSATLFNFPGMVLPGMYSHFSEIHFSWPFRNTWLISFPQWHLSSEVSAEIKQLSWIISDLHISVNHLTLKI